MNIINKNCKNCMHSRCNEYGSHRTYDCEHPEHKFSIGFDDIAKSSVCDTYEPDSRMSEVILKQKCGFRSGI